MVAAAVALQQLQPARASADPPMLTTFGNSMAYGLPLASHRSTVDDVWLAQVATNLGVGQVNGGEPGTLLARTVEAQAEHPERVGWLQILWAGHADLDYPGLVPLVVPQIGKLADYAQTRYLILGITNGTEGGRGTEYHTNMTRINAELAEIHGVRFLDVQQLLLTEGLERAGIMPTDQDLTDLADLRVPWSLRAEKAKVHLNLAGQTVVADYVTEHLLSKERR